MSVDLKPVPDLCKEHEASGDSLVMFLQEVQGHYGYLPREVLKAASRELDVSLARLYGLATFYSSFSLTEQGKHIIKVCDGTACHLRSGPALIDEVRRQLGIEAGETTEDKMFTLDVVACLGACALAPVMTIDSTYYGNMTLQRLKTVLDSHRKMKKVDT